MKRGLGTLPYGNSHAQTIGKCGKFRMCHDTGSACYESFLPLPEGVAVLFPTGKMLFTMLK